MRVPSIAAALLAATLALAPGLAFARAGSGASMGSRGGFTYSAPPSTATSPGFAAPMQRSMTAPGSSYAPGVGSPGYAPSYGGRSPFMSGLMGGLVGAGIGGLLFGGGLFHGIDGIGGFIGFLFQIFLVVMIARWLLRLFVRSRQPALAGMPGGMFARTASPVGAMSMGGGGAPMQGGAAPITVTPADFQLFEQSLKAVQAAWSRQDLSAMRALTTPEMLSYFSEQLSDQASRGVVNTVNDVRLEQGDLSQAWAEQGRQYATVAMRFSMIDVTRDRNEHVVDGSPTERQMATEYWTFVRSQGGQWILSAIQQTR
jgi:predicted lipid-binding transport protein (Tim44 family)